MNALERLKQYGVPVQMSGFTVVFVHNMPDEPNATSETEQVCDLFWAEEERFIFVSMHFAPRLDPVVSYNRPLGSNSWDEFYVRTRSFPAAMCNAIEILNNLKHEIIRGPAYMAEPTEKVIVSSSDFAISQ